MKIFKKVLSGSVAFSLALSLVGPISVFAATTPSLGAAATYGVLSSTYTNTVGGTTINGDVGFTVPPAVAPTGVHTNYGSGAPYSTAGTDQGSTLTSLAAQPCTFTFAPGAIDLATDTTHGPIGVYTPGVYCTSGAASIGAGGMTLSGSGTYIFRVTGALTSVANSLVTLAGASACDVFWTPTAATTLGANSTFAGNDIDASGITIGSTVTWTGRALAFGGTVSTTTDTITVPTCALPPVPPVPPVPPTPATLHVIKTVINDNSGVATAALFNLHVKLSGVEVAGSPAIGIVTPGRFYTLDAGTYVVSEDTNASYTQSFSGACDSTGSVTLTAGSDLTCTITNNDIAPVLVPVVLPATLRVVKVVINDNGRTRAASSFPLFVNGSQVAFGEANIFAAPATYTVTETGDTNYTQTFSGDCNTIGNVSLVPGDNKTCTITNNDIAPVVIPTMPNTGIAPEQNSISWNIIIPTGIFLALFSFYLARKKRAI